MKLRAHRCCNLQWLVVAALGLTASPSFAAAQRYGDVNGDDVVDIIDALLISQYYVGLTPAGAFSAELADVDNNDTIDIVDALLVSRYYVDLIPHFPAIDLSKRSYFPPVGDQTPEGTCTAWSAGYYYSTFLQARDLDLDASSGDPENICSVHYLFRQYNIPPDLPDECQRPEGDSYMGAECTRAAMETLTEVGCASEATYPSYGDDGDGNWTPLPLFIEPDSWSAVNQSALSNRTGPLRTITFPVLIDGEPQEQASEAALEAMKQVLSTTQLLVTRAHFGYNYWGYPDAEYVNNGVMYDITPSDWYFRHSLAIVGYDDNRTYVDASGATKAGAFLLANSEGDARGVPNTSGEGAGFLWIAYEMFTNHKIGFYVFDEQDITSYACYADPCYDNEPVPTVYYHDPMP